MTTPPEGPGGGLRTPTGGRYRLLAASGLVVVAVLLVFQFGLQGTAGRLGALARPQRFTELYFGQPTGLRGLAEGRPVRVTFVIDSREGASHTYRWSVVALRGTGRSSLATGRVELAPERSFRRTVVVPAGKLAGASRLEVRLADPAESIDLHLAPPAGTTSKAGTTSTTTTGSGAR